MQEHLSQIASKNFLADDVVELNLRLLRPRVFNFRAGQFVFFNIGGAFKAYSMTSLPAEKSDLRFLIRLEPGGKASEFIRQIKIGESLEFTGPEGYFVINAKKQNICCLAMGIGIAPFLSMVPNKLAKEYLGEITLIYGAKTQAEIFYASQIKNLETIHKNFRFIPLAGQRATEYIKNNYKNYNNHLFYVCGKPEAVNDAEAILKGLGHDESKIFVESFLH